MGSCPDSRGRDGKDRVVTRARALAVPVVTQLLLLLAHLSREEVIQAGTDDGGDRELAEFVEARGDGGGQDVGRELELEGERQVAAEPEPDGPVEVWLASYLRPDQFPGRGEGTKHDPER